MVQFFAILATIYATYFIETTVPAQKSHTQKTKQKMQ